MMNGARLCVIVFVGAALVVIGGALGLWSAMESGTSGVVVPAGQQQQQSQRSPASQGGDSQSQQKNAAAPAAQNAEGPPQPTAPEPTLAPPGGQRPGEWNGIKMTVNTRPSDVLVLPNSSFHIEPIGTQLRKSHARIVRRLRLLYPAVQASLSPEARRVWIDLGARFYLKGSTQWFVRHYPDSKSFEVAAFDVLDLNSEYPDVVRKQFKKFEFFQKAAWVHDRGVEVKGKKMAHVKEKGKDDPADVVNQGADNRKTWTIESVDFAEFLLQRYKPEDFVVLKMDIEGGEWEVLARIIETGAYKLIDELMLECHPRVALPSVNVMHQSCLDLTNHFRTLGVAAHRWV